MSAFDWGQLAADVVIGLLLGLHTHEIRWRPWGRR